MDTKDEQCCRVTMRSGLDQSALIERYDEVARTGDYDKHLNETTYTGPQQTTGVFNTMWPAEIPKSTALILDVGAGTGTCGKWMSQHGFECLHALEPSAGMAEVARRRNIYKEFYSDFLGSNSCSIADDTFDGVVSSGAFGPSHVPCHGLYDIVRVCKPGALVCIGLRKTYLEEVEEYRLHMMKTFANLQSHGYINQALKQEVDNWFEDNSGLIFAFKVLKSGSLSY